jgi:2-polyprenyl-6-hydroxyphenyl methylase/3-demethylubiquinone-9 3-methyltransferase
MDENIIALFNTIPVLDFKRALLRAIPPLDKKTTTAQRRPCKICNGPAIPFDVVDLNKSAFQDYYRFGLSGVSVTYHRCSSCGFIFSAFFDDWSKTEFADFIYNNDYIKVDPEYAGGRSLRFAKKMNQILDDCRDVRMLDFGSGMGHFADEMRNLGFKHIESYDPFANPKGPEGPFDIITCFEVLEHAVDPLQTFHDMKSFLADDGIIIFSTALQPADIDKIRCNWWYMAPRNGHVCAFSRDTLLEVGQRMDLALHSGDLMAFISISPSTVSNRVGSRIGHKQTSAILVAPPKAAISPNWYPAEGRTETFRWTRGQEITWQFRALGVGGVKLNLEIPVLMQIIPEYINNCSIFINNVRANFTYRNRVISVNSVILPTSEINVCLRTPPLLSPSKLGPSNDSRNLGIALLAYDGYDGAENNTRRIPAT